MSLPKIKDIYGELEVAQKNDELTVLLNQNPLDIWVKEHPYIRGYKYIPIERIEFLLKNIFKQYKIEVKETKLVLNSVTVTVRVHYKNPVNGEWFYHDGVGAQEIQTKKNTGHLLLDMSNINRGAITMALPIAKTVAIKDACDHFGKLFGSDLNRKENINYNVDITLIELTPKHPSWSKCKEAIKEGKYTIDQIKSKYTINQENENLLCSN